MRNSGTLRLKNFSITFRNPFWCYDGPEFEDWYKRERDRKLWLRNVRDHKSPPRTEHARKNRRRGRPRIDDRLDEVILGLVLAEE